VAVAKIDSDPINSSGSESDLTSDQTTYNLIKINLKLKKIYK
jgi:hypothetical protein